MTNRVQDSANQGSPIDRAKEAARELFTPYKDRGQLLDARIMQQIATRLTEHVRENFVELWDEISIEDRARIEKLAEEYGVDRNQMGIEYIAVGIMFTATGEHFGLSETEVFSCNSDACFILLTQNHSMVTGGKPDPIRRRERTNHYVRLPSRTSKGGAGERILTFPIRHDIRRGERFHEEGGLNTSAVRGILVLPLSRADEINPLTRRFADSLGSVILADLGGPKLEID